MMASYNEHTEIVRMLLAHPEIKVNLQRHVRPNFFHYRLFLYDL